MYIKLLLLLLSDLDFFYTCCNYRNLIVNFIYIYAIPNTLSYSLTSLI